MVEVLGLFPAWLWDPCRNYCWAGWRQSCAWIRAGFLCRGTHPILAPARAWRQGWGMLKSPHTLFVMSRAPG